MAFYGCPSQFPDKTVPVYDLAKVAIVKAFRRILFQDFGFLEAARLQSGLYEGAYLNVEDFCTRSSFKDLVLENPHGIVNFSAYTNRPQVKGDLDESSSEDEGVERLLDEKEGRLQSETDVRTKRFITRNAVWPPIGIWAHWILSSRAFEFIMIGVILVSSLLMCVEGEFSDTPGEFMRELEYAMEPVDFFLLLIFLMEIALKWADDFPGFWNEPWNLFDLVVTCASLFTPIFDVAFPRSHEDENLVFLVNTIKYIRIARILRTLNVVTRLKKIMIIWGAITRTFGPLAFITILMLLFFYIFAIIGITMCDRFTKTHITNLHYVHRFEHLGFACLTLFQIFTIDHWFPILTELMQVMDAGIACVYVLTWLLLGTFIFKNIFAGVMVNNFQNIREELVNETYEISNKSKLFRDFDVQIDALQEEILKIPDSQKDWETRVFHLLDLIKASQGDLSPSLWPRDTLFQYYVILEALGNNISERDELLNILNEALLHHYN